MDSSRIVQGFFNSDTGTISFDKKRTFSFAKRNTFEKKTAEQFIKFRIKYIVNKMAYVIFK